MGRIEHLGVVFFVLVVAVAAQAEEAGKFVHVQQGDLPIILSAPHGGRLAIPQVDARQAMGRPGGGAGFVVSRDSGTEELALKVAAALEARLGRKPYYVIARGHRKFLDPNRPPELAFDDPDARPVYDLYHQSLAAACRAVQERYKRGLLLDLHGQGASAGTVYRGTQNGKTVKLLGERYGRGAIQGPASLFGWLRAEGWQVHPDPLDGKEQPGYTGGYIVQTYGSHQAIGVDAIQLEFGGDYRHPEKQTQTAEVLAVAVAHYARNYLGIGPPEPRDSKATPPPEANRPAGSNLPAAKP